MSAGQGSANRSAIHLDPPSPNPFDRDTAIRFGLDASTVPRGYKLSVLDAAGREVLSLADGPGETAQQTRRIVLLH